MTLKNKTSVPILFSITVDDEFSLKLLRTIVSKCCVGLTFCTVCIINIDVLC